MAIDTSIKTECHEHFQWCAPWLRGNGQVIVRVKELGQAPQWVLAAPEQPEAEAYRQRLEQSRVTRWIDCHELNEYLRQAWERKQRDAMLAEVMAEVVDILREGQRQYA